MILFLLILLMWLVEIVWNSSLNPLKIIKAALLVQPLSFSSSGKNTWEPYTDLRDNKVLHDYLKLKGLHRLINKQHR